MQDHEMQRLQERHREEVLRLESDIAERDRRIEARDESIRLNQEHIGDLVRQIEELQRAATPKPTAPGMDHVSVLRSEYSDLLQADRKLAALEAAGVDNWEGYGEAMRIKRESEEADENP